jgi:uncharacterized cupin superfamily protein
MIINLLSDNWDELRTLPGYRWSRTGVGRRLAGELLGASLYHLPPAQRSWPYHCHYANEELLIVFDGRPSLRTPEGELELRAGDVAVFRRGPDGAHQLINRSERPTRLLIVSTMRQPDVGQYLDSGKIGVFAGAPPVPGEEAPVELIFREQDAAGYWEGDPPAR